jgi:hypothetical protein
VIGLANTAIVMFQTMDGAAAEIMEETGSAADRMLGKGWGLMIDGGTRRIVGLSDDRMYVEFDGEGELMTASKRTVGAVALIHRSDNAEVRITALKGKPPLVVIERKNSYRDREWPLQQGDAFKIGLRGIDKPNPETVSDMEGAERGVFRFGDRYFEIIVL